MAGPCSAEGDQRDLIAGWTSDSRGLFVTRRGEIPLRIYRFDITTGQRAVWQEISLADRSGIFAEPIVLVTPDGRSHVSTVSRYLTDLYLVEGLK